MASLALSTSLLGLGALACSGNSSNDLVEIKEGETEGDDAVPTSSGADGTEPTSADDGSDSGGDNCGMPDPACTTNAACGNNEICVDCMCVETPDGCNNNGDCLEDSDCGPNETCNSCVCTHPCTDGKTDECTSDSQCDSGDCDPKNCTCEEVQPRCGADDQCDADDDCNQYQTCNLDTCACELDDCECQYGGSLCGDGQYCDGCACQPVPGVSDPADDCDADGTPIACTPSTDLLGADVTCDAGMITVTAYFEQPVQATPSTAMRRIVEFLDPLGYLTLRLWASAPGDGVGEYECSVIVPGVMMTDIGPDDVCQINPDGSFQFALSADSEMLATGSISDLFARSENSDPYHYDDGDPIPNPCM